MSDEHDEPIGRYGMAPWHWPGLAGLLWRVGLRGAAFSVLRFYIRRDSRRQRAEWRRRGLCGVCGGAHR